MKKGARIPFVYALARDFVYLLLKVWAHFQVSGSEHVPMSGPCILVANHASFLDPPAISGAVRHRVVHFMARDTLMPTRLSKWLFKKFEVMPIDRTRGDVSALRGGLKLLKEGGVLGLFPEGTRSLDGELQQAKGGIGFLIAKAGVPVIPAYVGGTFDILPKGAHFMRRGKVSVTLGKPISMEDIEALGTGRGSYEKISDLVMTRIAAIKEGSEGIS